MRPGLTCLWTLEGRDELDFETWMRKDVDYLDNWSLALDRKILLRTIPRVLSGRQLMLVAADWGPSWRGQCGPRRERSMAANRAAMWARARTAWVFGAGLFPREIGRVRIRVATAPASPTGSKEKE
jgi:hypothetical protein